MHRSAAMPDGATFQSDYHVKAKIYRSEVNVRIRRMADLLVAGALADHVNLINALYGWCLAASDTSGKNHTPVILGPCDPGPIWNQNAYTTWQLG